MTYKRKANWLILAFLTVGMAKFESLRGGDKLDVITTVIFLWCGFFTSDVWRWIAKKSAAKSE